MTLLDTLNNGDRFAAENGIQITELRPGYCRAEMTVEPHHLNAGGVCQGGAIFTLGDLAIAGCANAHGKLTLSINCQILFLRPAKLGDHLKAECTTPHCGRITAVETRITNADDELVAFMSGECYQKETPFPTDGLM